MKRSCTRENPCGAILWIMRVLVCLLILAVAAHAEEPVMVMAAEEPVTMPGVPEKCVLVSYAVSAELLGEVTEESLRSFLGNNGVTFKDGGYAVYVRSTGALMVATGQAEQDLFAAGLRGD